MSRKTGPETRAQLWHERHAVEHLAAAEYGACWCCCTVCDLKNPWYPLASNNLKATP